jgi:hypothetical protein
MAQHKGFLAAALSRKITIKVKHLTFGSGVTLQLITFIN